MLKHQTATLFVALATLVVTIFLYIIVPKGFFPVQDTGIIQGISEAPEAISFPAMAERQQALTKVILQDPAVESLSSFIGVDGTNTTLNSGRILINLKPLEERHIDASDVIRRLQPELAKVDGITLYMQPVQDLTVEDRVSRTQYQYTLEDPDQNELNIWTARFVDKLKQVPELRDVATDQQTGGLAARLVIDRQTASRMGISPQMIDQTLYDSFGQRQISTLYTQLNQYHIILETLPSFQRHPDDLHDIYVRSALAPDAADLDRKRRLDSDRRDGRPGFRRFGDDRFSESADGDFRQRSGGAAQRDQSFRVGERAALDQSSGTISGGYHLVQPRARCVARRRDRCNRQRFRRTLECRSAFKRRSRARLRRFRSL